MVRLEDDVLTQKEQAEKEFQFLNGAIGRMAMYGYGRFKDSFNSLMVRLEEHSPRCGPKPWWFQFLNGAIGRNANCDGSNTRF